MKKSALLLAWVLLVGALAAPAGGPLGIIW